MRVRLGYELLYDCPQPTPVLLLLSIHHSHFSDIVLPDHLKSEPALVTDAYRDGFGNWCTRFVMPAGRTRLSADAIVNCKLAICEKKNRPPLDQLLHDVRGFFVVRDGR